MGWAFQHSFERWRHQYPQYIPSHPTYQKVDCNVPMCIVLVSSLVAGSVCELQYVAEVCCYSLISVFGSELIASFCLLLSEKLSMRISQRGVLLLAFSVAPRRQAAVAAAAAALLGKMAARPPTAMCALNVFAKLPRFCCLSFSHFGDILFGRCRGWLVSEMFVNFKVLYLDILFPHRELLADGLCCKMLR